MSKTSRCRFPGRRALPLLAATALLAAAAPASAATPWVDLEGGGVWNLSNDVGIPGKGAGAGTRFSLTEGGLSVSASPYFRARLGVDLGAHTVTVLAAPLRLQADGRTPTELRFKNTVFAAGTPLHGTYRFDSYRLTYRYGLVRGEALEVDVGVTAKIRDAAIRLCASTCTTRSDTGFVPLVSFRAHWRFAGPVGLLLDGDAIAGLGPGRAEDVTLAVTFLLREGVTGRLGWRVVEGGADTDSVYNFAFLSYAAAGLTVEL